MQTAIALLALSLGFANFNYVDRLKKALLKTRRLHLRIRLTLCGSTKAAAFFLQLNMRTSLGAAPLHF